MINLAAYTEKRKVYLSGLPTPNLMSRIWEEASVVTSVVILKVGFHIDGICVEEALLSFCLRVIGNADLMT